VERRRQRQMCIRDRIIGGLIDDHPCPKNNGQNHRRRGDNPPQSFLHDLKLCLKNTLFWLFLLTRLNKINKQPHHVEKSSKPADHKDDV
jgi:hypothetical protein